MSENQLPPPTWVDRPDRLQRAVARLREAPLIAVDTESNSLFAYREQVCLVQFSTPDADYLIDPLAGLDLAVLGGIFADPGIEKVFHAGEYDLICLKRDFGFTFTNLFDTMLAGRILGREAVGLGSMLEQEFGISLDKRYQRADWGLRPLPPAQLAYARLDSHYLIPLRANLKAELVESGRWGVAQEDFQRLTLVEGREPATWQENWWRIPGTQDLSPRQNAVLQQMCRFRDRQARALNRPPFKVMSNQALVEIARLCPRTAEDLENLEELNPRLVQRFGSDILHAVADGLQAKPVHRPTSARPDDRFMNRLDLLRTWRKVKAKEVGVDSDVILPRDVMYTIAEANPKKIDDLRLILADIPSRLVTYGGEILKVLNGS
jgi:ribonuclease D